MARPRTVSDEQVYAAVFAAVGKKGAAGLTLADVAGEAGISAAGLVQRFGTKHELLLAVVRHSVEAGTFVGAMRAAYEKAPDPVRGLISAFTTVAGDDLDPQEFANHLTFLQLELADDDFRPLVARHDAAIRAEVSDYLHAAVAQGLLAVDDIPGLAAAVNSLFSGTQISWAMSRKGRLRTAIRRDLEALLRPYARLAELERGTR